MTLSRSAKSNLFGAMISALLEPFPIPILYLRCILHVYQPHLFVQTPKKRWFPVNYCSFPLCAWTTCSAYVFEIMCYYINSSRARGYEVVSLLTGIQHTPSIDIIAHTTSDVNLWSI
jgi:hypothetical protein